MIAKVDRKYNYTFSNATNKYVICERRNLEVTKPVILKVVHVVHREFLAIWQTGLCYKLR